MKRLLAWTFMTTFAAACGGNVSVDPQTTTSGEGGTDTGGTGGIGGIGGTGGVGATGGFGGTGGTGGTGAKICGGKQGFQCDPGEWCQYDPPGACGGFDNAGICQPAPSGCTADCPGACGCDGQFYCNACEAHWAGVDTTNNAEGCGVVGPPDEYKAYMLPTNAPRYAISKAEFSANRCLLIVVAGFGNNFPNIDSTMGWNVESITITPDVNDCTVGLGWPPPPTAIKTDIAKGVLKQSTEMWPCSVDIDISIGFPPGSPSWVPSNDAAQASALIVSGSGCGL